MDGAPPVPSGLVRLAFCDDNRIGRSVFEAVARSDLWAFSLGSNGTAEVSLTGSQAYTKVLGRAVGA